MKLTISAAATLFSLAGGAYAQAVAPDLSWLAGSWVQEADGRTVREAWLGPDGSGVMAGVGMAASAGRKPQIEFMRIDLKPDGATFTAMLEGQTPTAFVLLPGPDGQAVFENKAHDFPQRVIYRRCGQDLCARIEGMIGGKLEGEDWRYRRAAP